MEGHVSSCHGTVKMNILVLSYYYKPDIGPGALRASSIVDALIEQGPSNLKIDVLTTMPNRYHSFKIPAMKIEKNNNVSIHRFSLPSHKNRILDQTLAFISFSLSVQKFIIKKKWDVVVATSGRLMTASLAAWVAKQTRSKLYLDIRDLFTDTMKNILANKTLKIIMPIFTLIEKWTFLSAHKVNLISYGFKEYFQRINPNVSLSFYTNGVDEIFQRKKFLLKKSNNNPLILYAGNIGDGQGLEKIIPLAARELKHINFKLIGDGSATKLLTNNDIIKSHDNVEILNPITRVDLIEEYQKADILFLHLNNLKAFHKVLPSKIFEYAATAKPILAGISGYGAKFLKDNVDGVAVFEPGNLAEMKIGLQKLLKKPKSIDRQNFCKEYSRSEIMKKFAKDILLLLNQKRNT